MPYVGGWYAIFPFENALILQKGEGLLRHMTPHLWHLLGHIYWNYMGVGVVKSSFQNYLQICGLQICKRASPEISNVNLQ